MADITPSAAASTAVKKVNSIHDEKFTLVIDVNLPGHDERVTTPLFSHSRDQAIKEFGDRCTMCNRNSEEAGPIQWHHKFIERCLAEAVDWYRVCEYIRKLKAIVDRAYAFCEANPELDDIMTFVDDMRCNGEPLCQRCHTGAGTGIHFLPEPLHQLWATGKDGFVFTKGEAIEHADDVEVTVEKSTTTTADTVTETTKVTVSPTPSAGDAQSQAEE